MARGKRKRKRNISLGETVYYGEKGKREGRKVISERERERVTEFAWPGLKEKLPVVSVRPVRRRTHCRRLASILSRSLKVCGSEGALSIPRREGTTSVERVYVERRCLFRRKRRRRRVESKAWNWQSSGDRGFTHDVDHWVECHPKEPAETRKGTQC